jgi:hypothetical protein
MPTPIWIRFAIELAVGRSIGVTVFRVMPIMIGSMKPYEKIASHIKIMKRV